MSEQTVSDSVIINEVQLVLAEKRTSLAAMRTGIAVFALPLSVFSVLIATSKYYDMIEVMHWLVPLLWPYAEPWWFLAHTSSSAQSCGSTAMIG